MVFIINFLSASGPGALSKPGSHSCREGGWGCPGVEAGGLIGGSRSEGRLGRRPGGLGIEGLCSFGWFFDPICMQLSISPFSSLKALCLPSSGRKDLWVLCAWQMSTEDKELPGVAQCGLVACSWPFLTLTPRAPLLRLGFVLRSLVCFLVKDSVGGWTGIHVELDPGTDTVSSEAHPSVGKWSRERDCVWHSVSAQETQND